LLASGDEQNTNRQYYIRKRGKEGEEWKRQTELGGREGGREGGRQTG
jgi:hypothetical protein